MRFWFLWIMCLPLSLNAALPPPPETVPIPTPTAQQTQTVPDSQPSSSPAPTQAIQNAQDAAKAWVLAIGQPKPTTEAQAQVQTLQQQGFSAFQTPVTNNTAQVWIGPMVDLTTLQEVRDELFKLMPAQVGEINRYQEGS